MFSIFFLQRHDNMSQKFECLNGIFLNITVFSVVKFSQSINQSLCCYSWGIGHKHDSTRHSSPKSIYSIVSPTVYLFFDVCFQIGAPRIFRSPSLFFLFPSGFRVKAYRVMLSSGLRKVWPIHLQRVCRISWTAPVSTMLPRCVKWSTSSIALTPSVTETVLVEFTWGSCSFRYGYSACDVFGLFLHLLLCITMGQESQIVSKSSSSSCDWDVHLYTMSFLWRGLFHDPVDRKVEQETR